MPKPVNIDYTVNPDFILNTLIPEWRNEKGCHEPCPKLATHVTSLALGEPTLNDPDELHALRRHILVCERCLKLYMLVFVTRKGIGYTYDWIMEHYPIIQGLCELFRGLIDPIHKKKED